MRDQLVWQPGLQAGGKVGSRGEGRKPGGLYSEDTTRCQHWAMEDSEDGSSKGEGDSGTLGKRLGAGMPATGLTCGRCRNGPMLCALEIMK